MIKDEDRIGGSDRAEVVIKLRFSSKIALCHQKVLAFAITFLNHHSLDNPYQKFLKI